MKLNYLLGCMTVAVLNLFIASPSTANETNNYSNLNPTPSIFNEPPYRGKPRQRITPLSPPTTKPESQNLLALAESNSSLTILVKALKAAGLTKILQGEDNLTIFAPTDAAFAKLPQDALQELLQPENKEILVKILTYHVVGDKLLSTDLESGKVKSLEGGNIIVKVSDNRVMVNEAQVVQKDITAKNGVIHAIDLVILPPDL